MPDQTPERPLPINDRLADVFFIGVDDGKEAQAVTAAEVEALIADQPSIEGDIGGPTLESVRRQFEEDFSGLLDPEHEPHTEVEPEATMPRIILSNVSSTQTNSRYVKRVRLPELRSVPVRPPGPKDLIEALVVEMLSYLRLVC